MSMPYVVTQEVWSAQASTATVALESDFERCAITVVEVTTTAFSGTLDIQGKLHEISAYSNIPYIRQDQAGIQTPSVTQLSYTTDTAVYRYVVLGYWRRVQLVMTRTAGSITCAVAGSSHANQFPYLPTKLIANSGVDIGDVDVLSIAAGTNLIGKVGLDQTTLGTTNGVVRVGGGLSNSGVLSADTQIKASAGKVYWMTVSDTADLIIDLEDALGSGTSKWGINLPAGGYGHFIFDPPIDFGTGIFLDVDTATCKVTCGFI